MSALPPDNTTPTRFPFASTLPSSSAVAASAPVGSTTLRCNGCELFAYPEGDSSPQRQFTVECSKPQVCSQTLVGRLTGPLQIANSRVPAQ